MTRSMTAVYVVDPREAPTEDPVSPERQAMYALARQTGGVMMEGPDLDAELQEIARDASAYYLIGYNSSQAPTAVLTNSDSDDLAGTVAVSDDTIAAPGAGSDHKVYVYTKPDDGWVDATETAQLEGSDSASGSAALAGISTDGSTIVAGKIRSPAAV